jgi:hypothetical protein
MDLGALAWAERSNKIAKEIIIVQNGGVPPPPPPTVSVDHTMNGDISVFLTKLKAHRWGKLNIHTQNITLNV